jgi:hypothetical protein
MEMDMKTETNMETETDIETEMEIDNTRKWTWPQKRTWTWKRQTFAKYFICRNCPNNAIWNASEISWRNFQWCYILVATLHNGNNDMKILKNSYRFWNSFSNNVLAARGMYSTVIGN